MNEKVKKFFEELIIDEMDDDSEGKFGHYPFVGKATDVQGKNKIYSLANLSVEQVVGVFARLIHENHKDILVSIDFPNAGDIMTDFIAVLSYIDGEIELDLLPYDNTTGVKTDYLKSGIIYEDICQGIHSMTGKQVKTDG